MGAVAARLHVCNQSCAGVHVPRHLSALVSQNAECAQCRTPADAEAEAHVAAALGESAALRSLALKPPAGPMCATLRLSLAKGQLTQLTQLQLLVGQVTVDKSKLIAAKFAALVPAASAYPWRQQQRLKQPTRGRRARL